MPKRLLAVTFVFVAAAASCGGNGTITIDGRTANDHGTAEVSGESTLEFELDDFYFGPTVLRGEPGQMLALEAFNEGGEAHTFTIAEEGIDVVLEPERETTIEITFPDSGTVVFVCRFHSGQGMNGALEIA